MRIRLIQASWLIVAGIGCVAIAPGMSWGGDGDKDQPKTTPPAVENVVRLEIQIAGLGVDGAKVAVKPAHPGCKFPEKIHTIARGTTGEIVKVPPFSVAATTTTADRDCSFEIVVTEPGKEPRTFRRGLRLNPPPAGGTAKPSRTLKCYLATTAVAVKTDGKTPTRR